MRVLNLVTTPRPFFRAQCRVLEERGVYLETLQVPGRKDLDDSRSIANYVQFVSPVIRKTFSDFDIIHANFGLTAPFAFLQPHRPVVLSLWGSDLSGKYGAVTKCCAKLCDEVIVMSEEMKTKLGQDAHVIPHGIDMKQFKPMPQTESQRAVGWDSERAHVLFPYDPSREVKNYPLANRVVEAAREEISLGIELHAVYGVDHADVTQYMNAADALLLTSQREGFPNSVKEAMACNLPVVSTDVGGVRERLSDVRNSYVCENESELSDRLTTVLQRRERSNGREHIQDLSLDQMGEQIIEVYEQAIR
jgi:teichuronic acid biosynthesis glycosyltransferase TuaC